MFGQHAVSKRVPQLEVCPSPVAVQGRICSSRWVIRDPVECEAGGAALTAWVPSLRLGSSSVVLAHTVRHRTGKWIWGDVSYLVIVVCGKVLPFSMFSGSPGYYCSLCPWVVGKRLAGGKRVTSQGLLRMGKQCGTASCFLSSLVFLFFYNVNLF